MHRKLKIALYISLGFLAFWTLLTFWVEYAGKQKLEVIGSDGSTKKALIVYNPDPLYNLDEQVCKGFAAGLTAQGISATIATVKMAKKDRTDYDLYVFCANTYNWAPDWQTVKLIKQIPHLDNKNVVAITLGSGSTARAKRKLEEAISARNANLMGSKTYWLLRPNDENRMEEKNNLVATDMATQFGLVIGKSLRNN